MKYSDTVLFSDLDGTLLDPDDRVSEENRQAVAHYVEAGGVFAVSSGRPTFAALHFLEGLAVNGPCIFYNGCAVYAPEENRFLKTYALPKERMEPLLLWARDNFPGVDVQIHTPEYLFYITPEETVDQDFLWRHQREGRVRFVDMPQVQGEYLKALFDGDPSKLREIERRGREELGDVADFVYSNPLYLEVLPKNVNKGTTLPEAMQAGGLVGRKVLAVGDYDNDLQLLKAADIGIAVGNALEKVKQAAQYVVRPNTESAIADIIDNLIPKL